METLGRRSMPIALALVTALCLSGCNVIEGIFKAGVWVGVVALLVVVAFAGGMVAFIRNRQRGHA